MQRILVPTDFSPVADNALSYAIEIGANFKSELLLYHVYHMHNKIDYDLNFPDDEQPFVKKLERNMNFTKGKFMEKIKQKELTIQTRVEEGNVLSLFGRKVMKHDINLIIMGSKGASGLAKVIFGSFAADALEMSKVPVLVVPSKHDFAPVEQIVLATDLNEVSTSILSPLQKLAFKFDAKVTILHVNTGSNKNPHQRNIYLKDIETAYHEVPMSKSINESINEFIEKNKCDLLCMIRREKGFFEGLFKGSITKSQVYSNRIPLLVLPEK